MPGISDNVNNAENEKENGASSPRGGKYNLRPNPNPNYTDEYRYKSELLNYVPIYLIAQEGMFLLGLLRLL